MINKSHRTQNVTMRSAGKYHVLQKYPPETPFCYQICYHPTFSLDIPIYPASALQPNTVTPPENGFSLCFVPGVFRLQE